MPKPDPLPLDLAHLDDLRERITQADEAIVSFICLRVQLGREELAYRRERGLPEWDRGFMHREITLIRRAFENHDEAFGMDFALDLMALVLDETGAVDDGRVDPATDAIPY